MRYLLINFGTKGDGGQGREQVAGVAGGELQGHHHAFLATGRLVHVPTESDGGETGEQVAGVAGGDLDGLHGNLLSIWCRILGPSSR